MSGALEWNFNWYSLKYLPIATSEWGDIHFHFLFCVLRESVSVTVAAVVAICEVSGSTGSWNTQKKRKPASASEKQAAD